MRGDDAIGIEIVREWSNKYPGTAGLVRVEILEIPGLDLINFLTGMDAVVMVDAIQDDQAPGTIQDFTPEDLESFESGSRFAHGWGVAETLKLAGSIHPGMDKIRISIIGISIQQVNVGQGLGPEIREAIPAACLTLEKKVQSLLAEK